MIQNLLQVFGITSPPKEKGHPPVPRFIEPSLKQRLDNLLDRHQAILNKINNEEEDCPYTFKEVIITIVDK